MPIVTIRDQSQIKQAPNMPRHEREWLLLVLMERGEARYETVTMPDGTVTSRSIDDRREDRWRRNREMRP